ncbi:MAG: molybdate ABC transporter substrate-binding protein [Alphaproteobacteria bacterium]|nr:molybdate ABC transporter substrate-binding protein [Alphaproteobacteria bacterium]
MALNASVLVSLWLFLAGAAVANSARVTVAVAANFAETLEHLQPEFEKTSGHTLRAVVGSTGKLYAQIINGAPFDVFLSADQERPQRLVDAGLASPSSRFTYATGRLILWSADEARDLGNGAKALAARDFRKIAIPNPQLAPYGAAAQQVLEKLRLWKALQGRIVMGENVGQTYGLVASGNAEIGFVSQSSYLSVSNGKQGVFWAPSRDDHAPIHQDAVVLKRAAKNPAAAAFTEFLKGQEAQRVLKRFGYVEEDR